MGFGDIKHVNEVCCQSAGEHYSVSVSLISVSILIIVFLINFVS